MYTQHVGEHYTFLFASLTLIFLYALSYFDATPHEPEHHAMRKSKKRGISWIWMHLFLTFCFLMIGISLKLLLYVLPHRDDPKNADKIDRYMNMLSSYTGFSSLSITIIRLLHKGMTLHTLRTKPRRTLAYAGRLVLSSLHFSFVLAHTNRIEGFILLHMTIALISTMIDILSHTKVLRNVDPVKGAKAQVARMSAVGAMLFKGKMREEEGGGTGEAMDDDDLRYDSEDDQEEEEEENMQQPGHLSSSVPYLTNGLSDTQSLRDHAMDGDGFLSNRGALNGMGSSTGQLEIQHGKEMDEEDFTPRYTTGSSMSSSRYGSTTAQDEVLANMFNMTMEDIRELKKKAEADKDAADFVMFMSIKNNAGLL